MIHDHTGNYVPKHLQVPFMSAIILPNIFLFTSVILFPPSNELSHTRNSFSIQGIVLILASLALHEILLLKLIMEQVAS